MEKFRVLSLFAGIGGFDLGLERSGGFETVAFCEINQFCQGVLRSHWPNVKQYDDVANLTADRMKRDGIIPNVVCGGFPCQDLSSAGSRSGLDGARSGLWSHFHRLIGEIRPRYVIVENSPNLLIGKSARRFFGDLAAIGYDAEWRIVRASQFGAPHVRKRAWITAYPSSERYSVERRYNYAINSAPEAYREANHFVELFRRGKLPHVCARHDGLPIRLAEKWRAALGNAVVPQIPEAIGRAIMAKNGMPCAS